MTTPTLHTLERHSLAVSKSMAAKSFIDRVLGFGNGVDGVTDLCRHKDKDNMRRGDSVAPQDSRQGRKAAQFVDSKYHAELEGLIGDFELELVSPSEDYS